MSLKTKFSLFKKISVVLAAIMIFEMAVPTVALALTSGPGNPEFSSFEPVATTSMVSEFTGEFMYNIPVINIPGPNGTGYSLSLSYHSGDSPESEASWVGAGWTLNPGALMRAKRGYADDVANGQITMYNEAPANWTLFVNGSLGSELIGEDFPVNGSAQGGLRYNNYKGFGYTTGLNLTLLKGIGLGLSVNDGDANFSYNINPMALLDNFGKSGKTSVQKDARAVASRDDKKSMQTTSKLSYRKTLSSNLQNGLKYFSSNIFNDICRPTSVVEYNGQSYNMDLSGLFALTAFQLSPAVGAGGSYTTYQNISKKTYGYYGYLQSGKALDPGQESSKMDYYVEKESNYNTRDMYLSIPFSNADNYSITGEGVIGGFRAHSLYSGHFRPNSVSSSLDMNNANVEISSPSTSPNQTIGVGFDICHGSQTSSISRNWSSHSEYSDQAVFEKDIQDDYCFRFTNDMGGNLLFGDCFYAERAGISDADITQLIGFKSYYPTAIDHYTHRTSSSDNYSGKITMSNYIAYNTNNEMVNDMLLRYDKQTNLPVNRNNSEITNQIGEFSVVNEDGKTYVYGLPVYSMNESNLNYYIENVSNIKYNDRVNVTSSFSDVTGEDYINGLKKVGQTDKTPYANSYLLTAIYDRDYVDVNNNGPDASDLGGWVKFNYTRTFGGDFSSRNGWYKWRMPYSGLNYCPNDAVETIDDMGSVSLGYKEVYYLNSIETKTHKAVFNLADRTDGLPANSSESTAITGGVDNGTHKLKKLESICLYSKSGINGQEKEIQKVKFEYYPENQSAWKNSPNALNAGGKLTLKRVWFEYEGVVNAKIAPYEFEYTYPTYDPTKLDAANYVQMPTTLNQTPDYSPYDIDRWGFYQKDGATRKTHLRSWVNQKPDESFDPAAWQLKVIKLPSGGEIHVQYEQNDYTYVQNRRAMMMVPIVDYDNDNKTITIDPSNILESNQSVSDYVSLLNTSGLTHLYFKFLYNMRNNNSPQLFDRSSDYIDGFVDFTTAREVNSNIEIEYSGNDNINNLCRDCVKAEKNGKLYRPENASLNDGSSPSLTALMAIIGSIASCAPDIIAQLLDPSIYCNSINYEDSYVRLPVFKKKLGGGIRVKRLLMYEANSEFGTSEKGKIYGNEYYYVNSNGESSGVATNEPQEGREENALILPLSKRKSQSDINIITAGRDKEQFEGPIGESILPAPSIGYSRVVIKNIYSGKTNTGIRELEFYTVKDFPFDGYYGNLGASGVQNTTMGTVPSDEIFLSAFGVSRNTYKIWRTQGYCFYINKMHGQKKGDRTYTFKGDVDANKYMPKDDFLSVFFNPEKRTCTSSEEIEYYSPGEKVLVTTGKALNGVLESSYDNMGVESEVVHESRSLSDFTINTDVEVSLELGSCTPLFFPYTLKASPGVTMNYETMSTHVTTKTITFPCIQKKVSRTVNGLKSISENLVFDKYTGNPVVTKTYDEYDTYSKPASGAYTHDGSYTTMNIPASHVYDGMGQKSQNNRLKITPTNSTFGSFDLLQLNNSDLSNPYIVLKPTDLSTLCSLEKSFTSGDLLRMVINGAGYHYYIKSVELAADFLKLYVSKSFFSTVLSVNSTYTISNLEIIRSGRANLLNETAAKYTLYQSTFDPADFSGQIPAALQNACDFINQMIDEAVTATPSGSQYFVSHVYNYNLCNLVAPFTIDVRYTYSSNSVRLYFFEGSTEKEIPCLRIPFMPYQRLKVVKTLSGWSVVLSTNINCHTVPLSCLSCGNDSLQKLRVVSSSAVEYNDNWENKLVDLDDSQNQCLFETGQRGKWRLYKEYFYKEYISSINPNASASTGIGTNTGNNTVSRLQDGSGTYLVSPYVWGASNAGWTPSNEITKYSSNGSPVEQVNILNVYSSAHYGFNKTLPILVASDATYKSALFEHFEMVKNNLYESGIAYSSSTSGTTAHSGKFSYVLPAATNINLPSLEYCKEGVNIKLWVKKSNSIPQLLAMVAYLDNQLIVMPVPLQSISTSGEWELYGAVYKFTPTTNIYNVAIRNAGGQSQIIDDLIVKPIGASANAYVYDGNTYRLLTSFDNDHFGTFYQYNAEGKLVRKIIETKKGKKTVQSNNYNTPLKTRL